MGTLKGMDIQRMDIQRMDIQRMDIQRMDIQRMDIQGTDLQRTMDIRELVNAVQRQQHEAAHRQQHEAAHLQQSPRLAPNRLHLSLMDYQLPPVDITLIKLLTRTLGTTAFQVHKEL
jgi:hypothetical protein